MTRAGQTNHGSGVDYPFAIRDLTVWLFVLLMLLLLLTGGCKREEVDIPQEGDVVTWKHRPELIIKTRLGQRREHVVADPRTDHRFYEPEYERFIGQFPIDYEPEPFPKFTEEELAAFLAEHASKIHAVKSIHYLEFSLMLNGVKAKATDIGRYSKRGMDDPNQVKVIIHRFRTSPFITKSGIEHPPYNTQQAFGRELMVRLDASSKETKDGLDCYRFKNRDSGKRCFGRSTYPLVSGFQFLDYSDGKKIRVSSQEFIYDGIKIEWVTDPKNVNRFRHIDAAVWRLLDAWNVSPIQNDNKI